MINFLIGIARRRHHSQVRNSPWTMFFDGVNPPKTLRPLLSGSKYRNPFLPPQAGRRSELVF
jgi:hypothetical protein